MTNDIQSQARAGTPQSAMPRSPPLITIIVPAFEADVELRRCVDSIRLAGGESTRCEVIVVMPLRKVAEAQALLPGERVIAETRPSIYGAMNDGVAASSGQYLYFLGKDDILLSCFADMLDVLAQRLPSAMFCDVYWGIRGVYGGKPSAVRLLARNICHQGVVYSRAAFLRHGPYQRRMRVEADKLLNLRLLWDRQLAKTFHYMPIPIAWYSGGGFSTTTLDPVFRRLYPLMLKKYVGRWAYVLLVSARKLLGR
jgi:glycosyltransferase involved in cell wall biosynthesis